MSYMDVNEMCHCFELFSKLCMKYFSIDPLHYFSGFDLGFDILLKVIGVKLDSISDFSVYESVENKYLMQIKFDWNNDTLIFSGKKLIKKYIEHMNKYKLFLNMLNVDLNNK